MLFPPEFMFAAIPNIVTIGFIIVFGLILVNVFRGIRTWSYNNSQPVLTVPSQVVAKRNHVTTHHHNNGNGIHHSHNSTSYYITFEVESGDRMEFKVGHREYGMLAEGDLGKLTFQGTRYLGFERLREPGQG